MNIRIVVGDALEKLRAMKDESVNCIVTSPPYFAARDYKAPGQIGLERSPQMYVDRLVAVFREARRTLRQDGTFWLNIGDTYAASGRGGAGTFSDERRAFREERNVRGFRSPVDGLKSKDIIGIPWMLAFALRADGWYLRGDHVWAKPNGIPESTDDRPTRGHEYVFLLTKSGKDCVWRARDTGEWTSTPDLEERIAAPLPDKPDRTVRRWKGFDYWYDARAVRTAPKASTVTRLERAIRNQGEDSRLVGCETIPPGQEPNSKARLRDKQRGHSRRHAGFNDRWDAMEKAEKIADGANLRSVWWIPPAQFAGGHYAVMPDMVAEICIRAGCPAGGTVLDPFGGAGTTGLVAERLLRNAVLIELNPEYAAIAAYALATAGSEILLKRGDTFVEELDINKDRITVKPYGTGANPIIDGDEQSTYCVLIRSKNVRIENIDTYNGIAGVQIQGEFASGAVIGGTHDNNGSGIAVGGGGTLGEGENGNGFGPAIYGRLILADGCTITNSTGGSSQGDGIQIGEDATDTTHAIRNCSVSGSLEVGINMKSGILIAENNRVFANGWTGFTLQNNTDEAHLTGNLIEGNCTAQNGTPQVSVEDHAKVYSTNNIFKDPVNHATNATAHVIVTGQNEPDSHYTQDMAFRSYGDTYICRTGQTNTLGAVVLRTLDKPCTIAIVNGTFDRSASSIGRCIDGLNSTAVTIENAKNNIFDCGTREAVRIAQTTVFGAAFDYNQYRCTAAGGWRLMNGSTTVNNYNPSTQLATLFGATAAEQHGQHGDPLFADAANANYRLRAGSPALGSGVNTGLVTVDRAGAASANPPNRGAAFGQL